MTEQTWSGPFPIFNRGITKICKVMCTRKQLTSNQTTYQRDREGSSLTDVHNKNN